MRLPGPTADSGPCFSSTAPVVPPLDEGSYIARIGMRSESCAIVPLLPQSVARESLPVVALPSSSSTSIVAAAPTASRDDTPLVLPYSRGNKKLLMQMAQDPAIRQACANEIAELAYTSKARDMRESRLKLWDEVSARAQLDSAVFCVAQIYTVMGLLRRAGYRSASQYLHVAKQRHISNGGKISPRSSLACARCERAAKRGRGPSKQAQPLPLERFSELPGDNVPLVSGGFTNPRRAVVSASWRLLRETELAHRKVRDVRFYTTTDGVLEVESHLSVTKTDPTALGCYRTHRCTCGSTSEDAQDCCPCCCDIRQLEWIRTQHPDMDEEARSDLILYPDAHGNIVSKQAAIGSFEQVATLLELPLKSHNGARKYTGHCMRVTGAVFLAKSGVDVWRIMALGRWGSDYS